MRPIILLFLKAMQAAKEKKEAEPVKPNFTIMKREDLGNFAALGGSGEL